MAQDHTVFLQHIQTCYYFWFMYFRLCLYTMYVSKPFSIPAYRRQCSSLSLHPHQHRFFCAGYQWRATVAENHILETALLHLLPKCTKVKSWIRPQSLLDESASITLHTLMNRAEMFLTITISTLSLESVAPIEEKTCTLFGERIITHAPKKICRTYACKSMTYDTSLCHKIFPVRCVK